MDIRSSIGYTTTQADQLLANPTTTKDPGTHNTSNDATFENSRTSGWIVEPQLDYKVKISKGLFTALAGSTIRSNNASFKYIQASNYISDALLENPGAGGSSYSFGDNSQYKYNAVYARLNYNWLDKYLINLTHEETGAAGLGLENSSEFWRGRAWDGYFQKKILSSAMSPFLSFGKLRVSYGLTGNDQVGDYKFFGLV